MVCLTLFCSCFLSLEAWASRFDLTLLWLTATQLEIDRVERLIVEFKAQLQMAAVFVWQVLQVIGFSGGEALVIMAQGIDDFDEVAFLTDEKVTTLCKTVCKPGGAVVGQVITLTSESNL
jgi:hypothetical protein